MLRLGKVDFVGGVVHGDLERFAVVIVALTWGGRGCDGTAQSPRPNRTRSGAEEQAVDGSDAPLAGSGHRGQVQDLHTVQPPTASMLTERFIPASLGLPESDYGQPVRVPQGQRGSVVRTRGCCTSRAQKRVEFRLPIDLLTSI
jgi:hypothetical protein